jgi:glycogen debranching enzyme
VLAYLAATQARESSDVEDSQPGKILHEVRDGEMAMLGEVPFRHYYGSVDATPLFVALAGAYYERTGDKAFIESIWENIEMALGWIEKYGDADGDGFVEYFMRSPKGLSNQGWKDSYDAVFHRDGTLAEAPIALCEVQGYVYLAKRKAAEMALVLGYGERSFELLREAEAFKLHFENSFWCEDISAYALAIDGRKEACRVRSSNTAQCLYTGIVSQKHAAVIAGSLLKPEFFSGWGVRTIPTDEVRYNPMSYHNGSVWPHDNALIAAGLAHYGFKDNVLQILAGMYEASLFLERRRLPELFCGFERRPGEGPTLYPVACSPQAWSAATVFMLPRPFDQGNRRPRLPYASAPARLPGGDRHPQPPGWRGIGGYPSGAFGPAHRLQRAEQARKR